MMFSSAPARRLPFLSLLSTIAAVLAFLGTGGPSPAAETPAPRWSVGSRHVIPADAAAGTSLEIEYRSASESIWTKSPAEAGEAGATWLIPDLKPGRYFLRSVGAKTESNFDIIPSQRADYHWVSIQPAAPFAARDGAAPSRSMAGCGCSAGGVLPATRPFPASAATTCGVPLTAKIGRW